LHTTRLSNKAILGIPSAILPEIFLKNYLKSIDRIKMAIYTTTEYVITQEDIKLWQIAFLLPVQLTGLSPKKMAI
jgi:hypothetical protein